MFKEAVDGVGYRWHVNPVMLKGLGKCLCIVAAMSVFDGHLMVAQTWAWVNMINDRVSAQGVSAALDSTFSGDAPCAMCCAIEQERQDREEEAPIPESKPTAKFSPTMWANQTALFPPVASHVLMTPDLDLVPAGQRARPPSPPPRFG